MSPTGIAATIVWFVIAALGTTKVASAIRGLRVSDDEAKKRLDFTSHGEKGYHH